MFEKDKEMRQALLDLADRLDPDDEDTKRGEQQRNEVARELIGLINESTGLLVARDGLAENLQDHDEIPGMIREAIEAGNELHPKMKERRQEVLDGYGIEVEYVDHGYHFEFEGVSYHVTYPDEVIEVVEDGEFRDESDVPDTVEEFIKDFWDAWDTSRSEMLDRMEEIGFKHTGTEEYYNDYVVRNGVSLPITVGGTFPRKPTDFSIRSSTRVSWGLHWIWDAFEDPAERDKE